MENIYQGVRARLYAGKMGRRCLLASIGSSALRSADFSDSAPRAERERCVGHAGEAHDMMDCGLPRSCLLGRESGRGREKNDCGQSGGNWPVIERGGAVVVESASVLYI